ncbi:hypothetical protein [Halorhabdus sp. CUG00001]|uniref:DUF7519 family protein n=1 Tax=Halorhabdus sp. CUG00001 TaxID=2600297 RepID=UPI00131B307D|nr:hypothetical protein [Halorhabdus sp. CUG00001]
MAITPRPHGRAIFATGAFALLAVTPLAPVPPAFAVGLAGALPALLGTALGSRRILGLGVLVLSGGTLLAGSEGLPVPFLSAAMIGTVLVWDVGEQSINVAAQIGRAGDLDRPIFVHAAISSLGAMGVAVPVYILYSVAVGGQPVGTLLLLLIGAGFIISSLRL